MKLINTKDAAESILRRLAAHQGDFGYDVETSGLNSRRNHIVAYVLTFGSRSEDTVYVPVRHAGGGNLPGTIVPCDSDGYKGQLHWFEVAFAKIAKAARWNVVGHNLIFDLQFSARHNIFFGNCTYSCTQVRQALVDEFTPGFSLDASSRHMNVTAKKGDELYKRLSELFGCPADRKSMSEYWRTAATEPVVVDYACGDGVSTIELYYAQQKEIERQNLEKCWSLEQRTTRTLFRMQNRGIKIDVDYMQSTRKIIVDKCTIMREEFLKYGDEDGFKERSATHVEAVYRAAGYRDDDFQKTPTGRFSFKEEWMETNDVGQKLLRIRKLANLEASFIGPLLDRHLSNGRVHPNYNQLRGDEFGTISGRLSSNDPNIQQVPKHDEELSILVRRGFIPDDGHFWSSKDAKQCEPRIFAQYTGSKFLIDGYMQKPTIDLYNNLDTITGIGRQKCKKLALALFYIAGNEKAAQLMGSTIEEATIARNTVKQQIPEIEGFNKGAENNVKIRYRNEGVGYVKTVTGRRLRFQDMRFAYKAGNRIVQGGNGDYIKHACNEVSDYLESEGKGQLLLTCHDNIENQIEFGCEKIDAEVTKIMEDAARCEMINFSIPQEAECGTGPNWAVATFGDKANT